jgi:maltose O-acetyltransferase
MIGRTIVLQIVNLLFYLTPETRWYRFRAMLLRIAGVDCAVSARIVASARIIMETVSVGKDTFIGHQVLIAGNQNARITIGSNVDIAPRVVIVSGSHEIDMIGDHSAGALTAAEVFVQDGVWIGANTTVLPGVTIGRKSIIGAGSVVNCNIPPFCVAVGNPCRPIKQWDRKLNSFSRIKK